MIHQVNKLLKQVNFIMLMQVNFIVLIGITIALAGCVSFGKKLKEIIGAERNLPATESAMKPLYTKFSDNPNIYNNNVRRQYKRATKQSLAQEAQLEDKAGSLWVMKGQGSYLFSQNIIRMIGDPMSVRIDGEPKEQLQSKVNLIRKLLAKLEKKWDRRVNSAGANTVQPASQRDVANDKKSETPTKSGKLPVKSVSTRITERLPDGNYRIRGSQPFMIGSREYKVIVTGIVRAEDFSDDGISSSKLLDRKFDIVSTKRKIQ